MSLTWTSKVPKIMVHIPITLDMKAIILGTLEIQVGITKSEAIANFHSPVSISDPGAPIMPASEACALR